MCLLPIHLITKFYPVAIIFNDLGGPDLSYTIRLRHETPTRDVGRFKWYTFTTTPVFYPSGPRVYDK